VRKVPISVTVGRLAILAAGFFLIYFISTKFNLHFKAGKTFLVTGLGEP
jgi:hypothetical protein